MIRSSSAIAKCYSRSGARQNRSANHIMSGRGYKTAVVTGGANGLGEAICRRLAADGYAVTIADIDAKRGRELASQLPKTAFVETDVTKPEQVKAAIEHTVSKTNQWLNVVVNNAGAVGSQVPYSKYDVEEWKRIIDVNLNGTFFGIKYGLAQMVKQKNSMNASADNESDEFSCSIVNLSSIAGFRGMQNLGPYTATKFAVRGMTMAAAVEVGHLHIRVNAIAPTSVETPMVKSFIENSPNPEIMEGAMTAMNALPEFVRPRDVANACAFLISDQARYITGHILPVDAGALSRMANKTEIQRDPA